MSLRAVFGEAISHDVGNALTGCEIASAKKPRNDNPKTPPSLRAVFGDTHGAPEGVAIF
jgi:hypothetical protein